jgi:3-deoxy-manno-octulosonate cytidylyltransferase (CMP-KDO synthetase)
MSFKIAIPARFASQRLPGKPLLKIAGRPMIQWVFERAVESGAEDVVVATDAECIAACARTFGATVYITSTRHTSGTERLAEITRLLAWGDETIVVNLQGDEPLMPPANIRQVAENLAAHPQASIATLCTLISSADESQDPNVCKVVRDRDDFALYFSRAPIPYARNNVREDAASRYRHIGLYAYRAGYLKRYAETPPCELERIERLEQLRALWRGDRIHVDQARKRPERSVDTAEDLAAVETLLSQRDRAEQ